jgi:tRNA-splicing ligase RtcB (3'-phosphate/5'-hydroxy nucleic acid ligase)
MSPTPITNRLLSWAPDLDDNATAQAMRASRLPFIDGHVALMPDAHWGMGATVGSVIPTRGAIVPAAVGVDIGCGMIAARLQDLTSTGLPDDLTMLHTRIAQAVPAGVGQGHQHGVTDAPMSNWPTTIDNEYWTDRLRKKAVTQFGSLGSGNHFVEVCLDEQDGVWIVLHSGSRGVGNELARIHIDNAKALMRQYFIELEDPDLAYLVHDTPAFDAYITDMLWAQEYAMGNRSTMLTLVVGAIAGFLGAPVAISEQINCHHNFTQLEHHNGHDVWLTRKGAIRARTGDRGVIPGSMGTRSYIVSGLGNTASYCSCSHGAGRRLGRKQAERELTYESLEVAMAGKAWNHDRALLDEHPMAYKDIDAVMEAQRDLVTIDHTLHQILNYKGT